MAPRSPPDAPALARPDEPPAEVLADLVRTHGQEMLFRYRFGEREGFDYVSPTCLHLLGHTAEALVADPTLAAGIVHPEDRGLLEAAWRTAGTAIPPATQRVRRPDGSEAWLEVRRTAVFDRHGRLAALEGIVLDVTAQHHAETALREALALLQASLDALPAGVAVLDAEGRVLRVNEGWRGLAEQAGWDDPRRGVGGTYADACKALGVPEADAGALAMGLRRVLDGHLPAFRLEHRGPGQPTSPAEPRSILIRLRRYEGPGQARAVAVHEDVTEHRRVERALLELERWRSEERQREIERLREVDRFRAELLNTASHELNTPLTAMRLQMGRLKQEVQGQAGAERTFGVLDRNLERIIRLVNDMLDASRLESGRVPHRPRPTDLARVVPEVVEALEETARAAGVRVALEVRGPLPVHGDPERLTQVLLNLLGNALKFTPAGGRVEVRAAAGAGAARVDVEDTGIGFEPALAGQLFQPFSRLDDPAMPRRGGTGLGLYISRTIAEQHGGTLVGASEGRGRGARFTLQIPLRGSGAPGASGGQAGPGERQAPGAPEPT